jgi:hypothetical protein
MNNAILHSNILNWIHIFLYVFICAKFQKVQTRSGTVKHIVHHSCMFSGAHTTPIFICHHILGKFPLAFWWLSPLVNKLWWHPIHRHINSTKYSRLIKFNCKAWFPLQMSDTPGEFYDIGKKARGYNIPTPSSSLILLFLLYCSTFSCISTHTCSFASE